VKSKLDETRSQLLHREVTVDAVRVNPFAPSVTVRGLSARERTGDAAFARFDELYVNAAWTSIFYLAPVVDAITLVKPQLRLVRNRDRSHNFQDLLDEFMARPKSDAPMPKFALFNIRLVVRVGSLEMKGAHAEAGAQTANLGEIAIGDSK
jgi:hypothetical protein